MDPLIARGVPPEAAAGTLLRLEGRDALALLHRISTQSLLDLEPGRARPTLFCDARGRLLHRAWVAMTADRSLWLVRDDAPAAPLAEFIDRFVFREDARPESPPGGAAVRAVTGRTGAAPGTVLERDGLPAGIQTRPDWALVIDRGGTAAVGAPDPALERARIEAGLPRHGHEIADSFTPFEVGLGHEVHLNKGCYTGQEALLRMMTYHGVRRGLARVGGPGPVPAVPREIRHAGEPAGWITSAVAAEERAGGARWIGLAVIRLEARSPGPGLEHDAGPVTLLHAFEASPPIGLG